MVSEHALRLGMTGKELSRVTQELFIINIITTIVVSIVFVITLFTVPQFKEQQTLLWINGASLILNAVGVNWFYSAMEQYSYITVRSIIFKNSIYYFNVHFCSTTKRLYYLRGNYRICYQWFEPFKFCEFTKVLLI